MTRAGRPTARPPRCCVGSSTIPGGAVGPSIDGFGPDRPRDFLIHGQRRSESARDDEQAVLGDLHAFVRRNLLDAYATATG